MRDLSILIPARNEEFLARTIEDILANIEGDTEIIVVLDGAWAEPPIVDNDRVTIIYHNQSIGQRAATNEAARLSKAKYLMKVDAHCAFDKGFDVKMMSVMQDNWTVIPVMKNLHAFDWVCSNCKLRKYQGPKPKQCPRCGNDKDFEKEIVWQPRPSPNSKSYCFDQNLHFQYWKSFEKRLEGKPPISDTLSIQGSCFMVTREKYFELELCDEGHGSWGQQGVEVALKTWLSGGEVKVNHNTWYAHLFRTQEGFKFPYPMSYEDQEKARNYSKNLWLNNTWPKAIHNLDWLLEKFKPVPFWHKEANVQVKKPTKGVVYYTDNKLDKELMVACQKQIKKGIKEKHIVSVSLEPIKFGADNIVMVGLERGYLTMAKQILKGLEASEADIIFLCEHDVLYHPSHFNFVPPKKDRYYYNTNVWRVRLSDGHALYTEGLQQLSGLVAYKELLVEHFRKRVERIQAEGYSTKIGFEPGTHNREERIDDIKAESYKSEYPNLDIRHDKNLTPSRWRKEEFRNEKFTRGWTEADKVNGWGFTKMVRSDIIKSI